MRTIKLMMMALSIVVVGASASFGQVIPTSEWTQFASEECTVNGQMMPVGSVVRAFDQSGVHCGNFVVSNPGTYTMAVYGDDLFSPEVDEGCVPNEPVAFSINGIAATRFGQSDGLWRGNGPIKIEGLSILQSFGVTLTGPDEGSDEAGEIVQYSIIVENTGDGTDLFELDVISENNWLVAHDAPAEGFYLEAGASEEFTASVRIPTLAPVGMEDELTVSATSQFDGTNTAEKLITTTVDQQTAIDELDYVIPGEFRLQQNFPNPFNPETNISFELERPGDVRLEVFDILGRKQATLQNGYLGAGAHSFVWRGVDSYGRQSASGIYFYRLSSNEYSLTRKMTLLK